MVPEVEEISETLTEGGEGQKSELESEIPKAVVEGREQEGRAEELVARQQLHMRGGLKREGKKDWSSYLRHSVHLLYPKFPLVPHWFSSSSCDKEQECDSQWDNKGGEG